MGRLMLAFRTFWRILRDKAFGEGVERLQAGGPAPTVPTPATAKPAIDKPSPAPAPRVEYREPLRSQALTLLALLQQEGRLVDFLKENIAPYDDAQVGAAVRDVHRDCAAVLERVFALRPVMEEAEGSRVTVPAGFDAGRIRLTGNVAGAPPHSGGLRHQGWQATKLDLPAWSGGEGAARVVAPAEVEL